MIWRAAILAICVFSGSGFSAVADSVDAAGRIEFNETGGSCSAALIAPRVVATAAHCTPEISTESQLPDVVFRPGRPDEPSRVIRGIRHPLYDPESRRENWTLRFDIGVVGLAPDSDLDGIQPFPIGDDARHGETLFIVSWREKDNPRPRQRACPVLSTGQMGLVTLGCRVRGGESGAPVLRKTDQGLELVAIISSRAQLLDQPVAQASNVRLRLPPLLDLIAE